MERQERVDDKIQIDKNQLLKLIKEYKTLYKSIPDTNTEYNNQKIRAKITYNILDNILFNDGITDLFVKMNRRKRWVKSIDMRNKEFEKKIKDILDWYYLNVTGLRKNNGSYADTRIDQIIKKDDNVKVIGYVKYGIDDTGDGCSKSYTEPVELYLKNKDDEYHIIKPEEDIIKLFSDE